MVKLATAREARRYGPAVAVRRWEYINAALYVFAVLLLTAGFAALLPPGAGAGPIKVGLVVATVSLAIVAAVNLHDLVAHLAGVDYHVGLLWYDLQLGLVEMLVPVLQVTGCVLSIAGMALLVSQDEGAGYSYGTEKHAANTLVAGALLWWLGSILDAFQVYERADGLTQILQSSVQVPLLIGSTLFFIGAIVNLHYVSVPHHDLILVAKSWAWLCFFGCLLFLVGGLFNVLKVFMMHQSDGLRLEKLRGGAQERLSRDREGRVPLNWPEESSRRKVVPGEAARPVLVTQP